VHIELIPAAPEQAPVIANLLELYAHDFSEFLHLELGADGRFGYQALPLYWSDPGRFPFLIKVNGKLGGLALVKTAEGSSGETVWDMAEFFIVRAYRRNGIGLKAALQLWRRFPGQWEVRVMQSNRIGVDFWVSAIATMNGKSVLPKRVEKDGKCWHVFAFDCKPTGQEPPFTTPVEMS
jgi:predicted acetyltransferase